jgi:hypothetical protein
MTKFASRLDEGYKDFLAELRRWLEGVETDAIATHPHLIPNNPLRIQDGRFSTPENRSRQVPSALFALPSPTPLQQTEDSATPSLMTPSPNTDDGLSNVTPFAPSLPEREM